MSETKRISPYVRLRDQWRESVRKMFVAGARKKAIISMDAGSFVVGAIGTAERLGHVCIAKVEDNKLVIYARPAITSEDMPWDIRPDWTPKEAL